MSDSLAGQVLIASPVLRDPNFLRTIIYLCAHDEHGALGVVLNRPNPVALDEVLPRWSPAAAQPASLFAGGPVDLDSAIGLGWVTTDSPKVAGLSLVETPIAMIDLNEDPAAVMQQLGALRIYLGYAGWGAGQLESEISEKAWHVTDARPAEVFSTAPHNLWRDVVRRQPGAIPMWSTFSDDPRLN
jgi:putative transcriptional regulator